ncbi:MAG: FAD-dependent thymidylate synthase [bacterium]|nr:FAD-dependent thymidylate synthase [bacterium]
MEVILAGINVPVRVLENLPEEEKKKATPEIISAAYARISRSDKDVDELVDESIEDVSAARKSNESIIYGMGHHSVADHVIFNLNIKGVSRLLVESIEKRRLAGYTEKSQRYVTLDGDYIGPKEFSQKDLAKFDKLVKLQNDFYFKANSKLFEFLKKKFSDELDKLEGEDKKAFLKKLEGSAKEDARYSLCLATQTQLGCSYTGQTAELAIRELKYGRLKEEREFAKLLYDAIVEKAPSIIQLTDPELFKQHNPGQELKDDNFKYTDKSLRELVEEAFQFNSSPQDSANISKSNYDFLSEANVTLVSHNNPDRQILAALLHTYSNKPIVDCYTLADMLINKEQAKDFVKSSLKHISEFDKVPRAFETGFIIYEVITSASCFAQLKRHRMNTLLSQDYDPELGYTIPPNIEEIGLTLELKDVCDSSTNLYNDFKKEYGKAAEYCLTNAHRRRVTVATNIRQLYHISRIREDESAQWEIRDKTSKMSKLASKVAPTTTILLCGKHEFKNIYDQVMQRL